MPKNTKKYDNEKLDGRRKILSTEHDKIRSLYFTESYSQRQLAKKYNVSRKAIVFILYPERYKHAKELFKQRRKDGRYKETKEERKQTMRKYRAKKKELGYY